MVSVFMPARHGLGDILKFYFIEERGRILLAKLRAAKKLNLIDDIFVVFESFMNPSIGDIFANLDFPIKPISTKDFGAVEADHDNKFPPEINGVVNLFTNTPECVNNINDLEFVQAPTKKPEYDIPDDFILFNGFAGEKDRFLTDKSILDTIRSVTDMKIISVGKKLNRNGNIHCTLSGDIALEDKLNITEVFWLGKNSKCTISSLSFMRCFATLFNKKVIELVENPSDLIIRRTNKEYEDSIYGTIDGLSSWFIWPQDKEKFKMEIDSYVNKH